MKPRVTRERLEKVSTIVSGVLQDHFGDEFVFDPIVAIPKVDDHFSDDVFPYIHIYVIFDGDQTKLDPSRPVGMSGMAGRLMPLLTEIGVDEFPVTSYRSKADWRLSKHKVYQELERELENAGY